MLEIVVSYHCMEFQGNLMNQTLENDKKPSFRSHFGPFDLNLGRPFFFKKKKNWLRQSLMT